MPFSRLRPSILLVLENCLKSLRYSDFPLKLNMATCKSPEYPCNEILSSPLVDGIGKTENLYRSATLWGIELPLAKENSNQLRLKPPVVVVTFIVVTPSVNEKGSDCKVCQFCHPPVGANEVLVISASSASSNTTLPLTLSEAYLYFRM